MCMRRCATAKPNRAVQVRRLDVLRQHRGSVRRVEYLSHAYACHDMAQVAEDAHDRHVLQAMTILWEALAQRASAPS